MRAIKYLFPVLALVTLFVPVAYCGLNSDLNSAIYKNDVSEVKRLIKAGAAVNNKGHWDTPLNTALKKEYFEVAKILIEYGADLNNVDQNGMTQLMKAVKRKSLASVSFLINNGANNLDLKDNFGLSALMYLTSRSIEQYAMTDLISIARLLIENGAYVNFPDSSGNSVIARAVRSGMKDLVSLLLEKGVSVNTKVTISGDELIFLALDEVDMARLLVENGADVNAVNRFGYGVLYQAVVEQGSVDVFRLLIESGAKLKPVGSTKRADPIKLAENLRSQGFAIDKMVIALLKDAELKAEFLEGIGVGGSKAERLEAAKKFMNRGVAAMEMAEEGGDYSDAIEEFKHSLWSAPWLSESSYNLARVCEISKDYRCAIEYYNKYLSLAPDATDSGTVKTKVDKLGYILDKQTSE